MIDPNNWFVEKDGEGFTIKTYTPETSYYRNAVGGFRRGELNVIVVGIAKEQLGVIDLLSDTFRFKYPTNN